MKTFHRLIQIALADLANYHIEATPENVYYYFMNY